MIERAHFHGLTVTGHLDSGNRNSVNPRDADHHGHRSHRALHGRRRLRGGQIGVRLVPGHDVRYAGLQEDRRAVHHASRVLRRDLEHLREYGAKDTVFTNYFAGDERRFLTPYMRDELAKRPPRNNNVQFEKIYYVKRKEIKAFFDAGGGDLMTLGTDHPSWGEWFTPFSAAREMYAYSASGIPNWQILKIATINSARAMGFGDRLGTIEAGKWADLVVLRGNPLARHQARSQSARRRSRRDESTIRPRCSSPPRVRSARPAPPIRPSGLRHRAPVAVARQGSKSRCSSRRG